MKAVHTHLCALTLACMAATAGAQTTVADAWVRATAPLQRSTGMFANITSATGGRLLSASSSVAGMVEIHQMAMEGDVMKMRELGQGLELPAGKAVALKPGGYHVMMMELKQRLKDGDVVPVTLVIEGADKTRQTLTLSVPVRAQAASASEHKH